MNTRGFNMDFIAYFDPLSIRLLHDLIAVWKHPANVCRSSTPTETHPEWSWYLWRRLLCRFVWWRWTFRPLRRRRTPPCRYGPAVRWARTGRLTWGRYWYGYRRQYRHSPGVSSAGPWVTPGARGAGRAGGTDISPGTDPPCSADTGYISHC